jgi:phage I-like protein
MRGMPKKTITLVALAAEIPDEKSPSACRLLPAGEFRAWDGRPEGISAWKLTEADGARLVAEMAARKSARVIDYEHGTLRAKETGKRAPAAFAAISAIF